MNKDYWTYRICIEDKEQVKVEKSDGKSQTKGDLRRGWHYQEKIQSHPGMSSLLQVAQEDGIADRSTARQLGEALFDALFDETLMLDFVKFYDEVRQKEQLLRIELDIDERKLPEIAALPWEFMCLPARAQQGELWMGTAPDLVFYRRRSLNRVPQSILLNEGEKLRLALVIAAPKDLGEVKYEKVQQVLEKLANEQSDRIQLLPVVNPATPEAIDQLLREKPHIFHFVGHGRLHQETNKVLGQIALVDDIFEEAQWVDADFFSGLLARHRPGVIVLQACEGGKQSESQAFVDVASHISQENVPVVVAMQYKVSNLTASRFALRFYDRIAKGDPVDIAAQDGRYAIAINTQYRSREFATPMMFMRDQDGYLFKQQGTETQSSIGHQPLTHAQGDRSVTTQNAQGSTIITGDGNTVGNNNVVQRVTQRGKYNVNLGSAQNLHIGDKINSDNDKE